MRHAIGLFLATAVLSSSVGCCCKKGLVMRGDWSLELNRVPHMSSNGPQYQPDCDEAACCEETCGCAEGCTAGGCVGGSACRLHGGNGYASSSYGGPGFAGGAAYDHAGMHGGHHDGEGGHMPPPPNPTAAANTRFHPVPTRPVFERQVDAQIPAPAGEWVPSARSKSQPMR